MLCGFVCTVSERKNFPPQYVVSHVVPMCKVQLFISRICSDWDQLPEKMRKPMTYRDGCTLHLMCGMFLHFLDVLEARVPSAEFPEFAKKLTETFMCGVMGPELAYVADTCVPPGDVMSIGPFRLGVPTNDLSGLVICLREDFLSTFAAVNFLSTMQGQDHLLRNTICEGTRRSPTPACREGDASNFGTADQPGGCRHAGAA